MDFHELNRPLKYQGKYVFAPATLMPFRNGVKKPYNFRSFEQLQARFEDRLAIETIDPCEDLRTSERGAGTQPATFVATLKNGWCHGRCCDWIGIEDQAMDYFRYRDGCCGPRAFPLGRLNPRYWRHILGNPSRFPKAVRIPGRVVVLNKPGSYNYFHWLSELLPRIDLIQQANLLDADAYVVDYYKPFQMESLEILGIPHDRIIQPHNGLLIEADELIVPSFTAAAARRRTRQKLRNVGDGERSGSGKRIYISRRHANNRSLCNEVDVKRLLQDHNFEVHHVEQYSFAEQIQLFRDASVIVGVHGAGLTNIMLCPATTQLVEIRPVDCNRDCFPQLASDLNNPCRVLTAPRRYPRGPLSCSIDLLQRTIEAAIQHEGREFDVARAS